MIAPDPFALSGNLGDEPATAEQLASFEFEPFKEEDIAQMVHDFSMPAWPKEFGEHGVALRVASVLLRLTKEEMVAGVEAVERDFPGDGPGPTAEVLVSLRHTRERLSHLVQLLQAAELRQLSAAAVLELRLGAEGGAGVK